MAVPHPRTAPSPARVTTTVFGPMHHCRMGIVRSSIGRDDRLDASGSRVVDGVLVAVVALVGLLILLGPPPTADYRDPDVGAVVLVLASAASMWWWRTAPRAALFAACAVVLTNAAAGYTVGVVQYPVWIALYSVFARSPRRDRVGAMVAVAVTLAGYVLADRGAVDLLTAVGIAVAFTVAVLLGDGTRSRRDLAASERAAAELHEREQEAAMERLVLQERARLARELHDSVGHAINVMVMQAGVGRHVFDERPQFAREALAHVEDVGRVALGELDAVLRVLRPVDGSDGPRAGVADAGRVGGAVRSHQGHGPGGRPGGRGRRPRAQRRAGHVPHRAGGGHQRGPAHDLGPDPGVDRQGERGRGRHHPQRRRPAGPAGRRAGPGQHAGAGAARRRTARVRAGRRRLPGPGHAPGTRGEPDVIAVLLADDDVLVRQGLRVLIESADDLAVVAEAADGEEAVRLAATTAPDVVVMDVRMPG